MQFQAAMPSFSFFKPSKHKTPSELVKATRDALWALDSKAVLDARLLDKAVEEVEKNLLAMKQMLIGDSESESNPEQVSQLTCEACREDFLELLVHKLPNLSWEARKDAVQIWCMLLRQKVRESQCCLEYVENHISLLDVLVSCYENKETALNGGHMLKECARYPTLAKKQLEKFGKKTVKFGTIRKSRRTIRATIRRARKAEVTLFEELFNKLEILTTLFDMLTSPAQITTVTIRRTIRTLVRRADGINSKNQK